MKVHFNVTLDTREDETRVFSAKCLRCDKIIVGEVASDVPVVRATANLPPDVQRRLGNEVRKAWESAKKGGYPFTIPDDRLEIVTLPDHGLQRALDAHMEICAPKKEFQGPGTSGHPKNCGCAACRNFDD